MNGAVQPKILKSIGELENQMTNQNGLEFKFPAVLFTNNLYPFAVLTYTHSFALRL